MTKHHFSFQEVFKFGWDKTKQHAWFMVLTFIIISIIMSAVGRANFFTFFERTNLLNPIVSGMIGLSLVSIALTISRDQHFSFTDLITPLLSYKKVLKFFALILIVSIPYILTFLAVILCLAGVASKSPSATFLSGIFVLLLGVCSLYFGVRLKFFSFVVIEHENASISELIKMSYKLTSGHFLQLFALLIVILAMNIIGAMIFFGLFLTVPISLFAVAHVYNKLKEHSM